MRNQEPQDIKLPQESIAQIREKHRATVLSNDEIIKLVLENKPDDPHALALWLGGTDIDRTQAPVFRFTEILEDKFSSFDEEQKTAFLKGSANFILKSFKEREGYGTRHSTSYGDHITLHYEKYGQQSNLDTNRKNIGALLLKTLEFTNNDIAKSRQLLRLSVPPRISPSINYSSLSVTLLSLYAGELQPESQARKDIDRFREQNTDLISANPKIQELAFWVEADLGHMRPAMFDHLLNRVYPKVDGRIKTQIMIYLKEQIISNSVPEKFYKDIRLFLANNEKLYSAVRSKYPNSPFVEATDTLKAVLTFDEIIERTKGGDIDVEEMLSMVEKFPGLIEVVTKGELDLALNLTKDHGVALRIERLIRLKSTPITQEI